MQLIQGTPSQYYLSANSLGSFRVLPINYSGTPPAVVVGDPTFLPGRIVGGAAGATLFGLTGAAALPFLTSYVVNPFNPSRILVAAGRGLYESVDGGTTFRNVDPSAGAGTFTGLAYGGFDATAGANRGDIIVAAQGNTIWFRPPGAAAFQSVAAPNPGFTIVDLVLNPSDFRSGYAVARDFNKTTPDKVYHFILNPTTPAMSSVVDVTNNLKDSDLRTVEMVQGTSGVGDIVLAGGLLGVSRLIQDPSSKNIWTELGQGLANAPVTDLHYYTGSNLLLAGTFGRGAWTANETRDDLGKHSILRIEGTGIETSSRFRA